MSRFQCPTCKSNELYISASVDVEPKNPLSSEETIQTIKCTSCNFTGLALYMESHNGSANHDGYILDSESFVYLDELLKKALHDDISAKQRIQVWHNLNFENTPINVRWSTIFPMYLQS